MEPGEDIKREQSTGRVAAAAALLDSQASFSSSQGTPVRIKSTANAANGTEQPKHGPSIVASPAPARKPVETKSLAPIETGTLMVAVTERPIDQVPARTTAAAIQDHEAIPNQKGSIKPPYIAIWKRLLILVFWFILSLFLCYVGLIIIFIIKKDVTMEHMQYNGWARVASRATGGLTIPFYALHLLVSPASLGSMFSIVFVVASHLIHLAILWSDLYIFKPDVLTKVANDGGHHPFMKLLPPNAVYTSGAIAYSCLGLLLLERTFGPNLTHKRPYYGVITKLAIFVVALEFVMYMGDRLAAAIILQKPIEEILYPVGQLVVLAIGVGVALARRPKLIAEPSVGKKTD